MKLEKKVKKKLENLGIFLLSGFLIGIATYNFASAFSFPMVGFTGIGLIGYHLFGIPIGMTVVCLNIPMALISWKILGREFLESLYCVLQVLLFLQIILHHCFQDILEKRFWQFCVQRLYQELVML